MMQVAKGKEKPHLNSKRLDQTSHTYVQISNMEHLIKQHFNFQMGMKLLPAFLWKVCQDDWSAHPT
jgi:hypothetical protein